MTCLGSLLILVAFVSAISSATSTHRLDVEIVGQSATSQLDVRRSVQALLDGRSVWKTLPISRGRVESVIVQVAHDHRVTSFELASLAAEAGFEMKIDTIDAHSGAWNRLIPWGPYGNVKNDGSPYEAQWYQISSAATRFKISVKHTRRGAVSAGVAIFRIHGRTRTADEVHAADELQRVREAAAAREAAERRTQLAAEEHARQAAAAMDLARKEAEARRRIEEEQRAPQAVSPPVIAQAVMMEYGMGRKSGVHVAVSIGAASLIAVALLRCVGRRRGGGGVLGRGAVRRATSDEIAEAWGREGGK